MPTETLLIAFVAVTAAALVLQSVTLWRTLRAAGDLVQQVSRASEALEKDAREIMRQLQKTADSMQHLQSVLDNLANRAGEATVMLERRAADLDRLGQLLVEVGNRQAEKLDAVVTDTVAKFEETTAVIQQDILKPVVEISSVIKGLRTGIGYLFSRGPNRIRQVDPENDLFI